MSELLVSVYKAYLSVKGMSDAIQSFMPFSSQNNKYGLCVAPFHTSELLKNIASDTYVVVNLDDELHKKLSNIGENNDGNSRAEPLLIDFNLFTAAGTLASEIEAVMSKLNKSVLYVSSNYRLLKSVGCNKVKYFLPLNMDLNIEDADVMKFYQVMKADLLDRKKNKLILYTTVYELVSHVLNEFSDLKLKI
jgi:hypothetical protein